ncbi:MAG: hypothetical protein AAF497_07630, partial [Planctomycetota bacterium]
APFVRPPRLVIGIGVNLNNRAEDIRRQGDEKKFEAASLCEFVAAPIDDAETLSRIIVEFESLCTRFSGDANGLDKVWSQADFLLGRRVCVTLGNESRDGIVEGITNEGELILAQPGGSQAVRSGTVELLD